MTPMRDLKVKVLVDISEALSSSLDLKESFASILKVLSDTLEMKRGTITLVDPLTGELRIEVAHGLTRQEKERGRYQIGEGITGRVVETGQPMIIPDIEAEPMFLDRTQARKNLKAREFAFLCVPVRAGNKIIGALSVDHLFTANTSYEEDIKLLMIIASMAGQAVRVRDLAEKDKQAVVSENVQLRQQLKGKFKFGNVIYTSPAMEAVLEGVRQVAGTNATVLLRGESGTGKELVAAAIHYASPRAEKPFIKVACAALPENLLESELFGYERGAFTGAIERKAGRFELAGGGTIFLDEIGDLTLATQVKLLRVLQEKEFERLGGTRTVKADARVICATHRDLEEMVRERKFRDDLFYRINVFPVHLPPLRERKEDIPLLVAHFTHKYNKENNKEIEGVNRAALDRLMAYDWPGNVRELENVIERAVVLCRGELISSPDLPANLSQAAVSDVAPAGTTLTEIVASLEKQKIKEALAQYKTQRKAAKALGITERMLGYKVQKYNLADSGHSPKFKPQS
ncbi:MAG: sigma 54-interacting transcriptional regulator [Candidatus Saganbacteria bacterium]|nr:sigma 54-interacting transcriptional regulator [Candidatus Saganbacteria bacterium]